VNGWAGFKDVFMISAMTGDGMNLLKVIPFIICTTLTVYSGEKLYN